MKDKEIYLEIIKVLVSKVTPDVKEVQRILHKHPASNKRILRKGQVIKAYKQLRESGEIALSNAQEKKFMSAIQMKKVRTISGVTPVTVLTKPFPCPGKCIFCPNDVRMPKSYLSDEPGAQRAEANKFDPYLQTYNRLVAFNDIGHPTEKVELIVLGGTWSSYPEDYQIWFIKRCVDALNDFDPSNFPSIIKAKMNLPFDEKVLAKSKGKYNARISKSLVKSSTEKATWNSLIKAQQTNESANSRCVGMVLETRPDCVSKEEILRIRKLGGTKIQIGIQSLNDSVLKQNKRGHTVKKTRDAINLIRQAGFKIHAHWMPNLLGSSPDKDIADFKKLFSDINIRPDELKLYPCSLVQTAELMNYYKKGLWKPYTQEELLHVLKEAFRQVPRYCRVTRVIRDISSHDIVVGNKKTNFRQIVEASLKEEGFKSADIRAREVRTDVMKEGTLSIKETQYKTGVSTEVFIEYVTPNDKIAGFLRLSLLKSKSFIAEIGEKAVIREIHVYGQSLRLGAKEIGKAQHSGLGKNLIKHASNLAKQEGYNELSVISSVGTREYYRKNGFTDGELYQHLKIS